MWHRSSRFDTEVAQSATVTVRCDVLTQGVVVSMATATGTAGVSDAYADVYSDGPAQTDVTHNGLAVNSGSVAVNRTQIVRRKLQISIADAALVPILPTDWLQPLGNELRVWSGFTYADGSQELVPVFTGGIITTQSDDPPGLITVNASDRMQRVTDARFTAPRTLLAGPSVVSAIRTLLLETIPWGEVHVDPRIVDAPLPQTTFSQDRAQACIDLGALLGAEVWPDPMGVFQIIPVPAPTASANWTVGAGPNGVLVSAAPTVTRDGVRNAIIVTGLSTGAVAPSSGYTASGGPVCADYDPTSPTYFYGPFGQVPGYLSSSGFTSNRQCVTAGFAALQNYRGSARQVDFQALNHPALEGGDVVEIIYSTGFSESHILDQFTVPLDPATAMSGSTRAITDAVSLASTVGLS